MVFKITLKKEWFDKIKSGEKVVEGRLHRGVFKKINKDDIVVWTSHGDEIKTQIVKITKYKSFKEMLLKESLDKVLPSIKSIEDGVKVYRQFYSESDERQNGVVGLRVKLI